MTAQKLIQALTGSPVRESEPVDPGLTDAVFVEKLASAVDFISENIGNLTPEQAIEPIEKEAAAPKEDLPVDLAARLRKRLHTKLAARQVAEPEEQVTENVLGKLINLRASAAPVVEETSEKAPQEEADPVETESAEAEDEVGEKAASADLSLAEVLEGALQANELEEEVPGSLKTASARGVEGPKARKAVVDSLKKGLMAKFGKEA